MKYGQGAGNGQWGSGHKAGCGGSEDIAGGHRVKRRVRPVPHKSRAPARSVQAAHRRGGGRIEGGPAGGQVLDTMFDWRGGHSAGSA